MADTSRANFVSQAEFARGRGVSRKTVTGWKQKGLLVLDGDGRINVEATEWNLDQRPATYRGGVTHRPVRGQDGNNATHTQAQPKPAAQRLKSTPLPRPASSTLADLDGEDGGDGTGYDPDDPLLDLKQAVERKENYLGLQRRLDYLTKKNRLVDRAAAEAAFFDEARAFRDAWIAWPGRIAIEMAERILIDPQTGKVDPRSLATVLTADVQSHLAELGEPAELDLGRHDEPAGGVAPGGDAPAEP